MEDSHYQYLLDIVSNSTATNSDKIVAFISLSNINNAKGDISEALKYASMATIVTASPRADACCCIGDVYMQLGNTEWAIKWFESAISNVSPDCESGYYTWIPLMKIAQAHILNCDFKTAEEYVSAARKLLKKDTEEILDITRAIDMFKSQISKK